MKILFSCLLITVIFSVTTSAAEIRLSLEQALALAEKNDLELAAANLDVESGDATVREAISTALPRLTVTGTLMRHMVQPKMYLPDPLFEGGGYITISPPNSISTQVSLQQPIWLAGKVGMALKAAKMYRQIARNSLDANRANLKSDIIREYFGYTLASKVVEITRETHEQANRHAATVKRMFEVGMASEFDLLRAEVEVRNLEPKIARAEKNVELARIGFCNRLGLNMEDEIILTDELSPDIQAVPPLGYSAALDAVHEVRPEFKVIDLQEKLSRINVKAEGRNLLWPNFTFGLNYSRDAQGNKYKDLVDMAWPETFTWLINAQIPLFDGFATPAKVQKARIELRRIQYQKQQFEQAIQLEVSNTLSELKRVQDQMNSLKASNELAEKALDIAETRFAQGMSTELEVLDARLAQRSASLAYLQGMYDLMVANAEYARVVKNDNILSGVGK